MDNKLPPKVAKARKHTMKRAFVPCQTIEEFLKEKYGIENIELFDIERDGKGFDFYYSQKKNNK